MGGPWTYDGGAPLRASGVDREVIDEPHMRAPTAAAETFGIGVQVDPDGLMLRPAL